MTTLNTTRRRILRVLASAMAVISVPAAAVAMPAADPIFADSEDRTGRARQPRRSPLDPIEFDWEAILERAEHIVENLRALVGYDGIELDELEADRMLRWCRSGLAGEPDDSTEFLAVNVFLERHGQSIDWLLTGNPTVMIYHGAKLNVLGMSHRVYDRLTDHTPS
jgi:hypothetical protein